MSRIIISDVHGCYTTLITLLEKLPKDVPITFAGDLIDRGKDSRKVVEFVKDGKYDCVIGNHEVMMIDELKFQTKLCGGKLIPPSYYDGIWLMNGGDVCLDSYMIDEEEVLQSGEIFKHKGYDVAALREHKSWLSTLPYHILYDEKNENGEQLLVTHSTAEDAWGIDSFESNNFKYKVTWDRNNFPAKIEGIYNVYGHTPQKQKATVKDHFACIDTGVYLKRAPYGKLTALQWPEMIIYEQENVE